MLRPLPESSEIRLTVVRHLPYFLLVRADDSPGAGSPADMSHRALRRPANSIAHHARATVPKLPRSPFRDPGRFGAGQTGVVPSGISWTRNC
jgi:hypothetical protein